MTNREYFDVVLNTVNPNQGDLFLFHHLCSIVKRVPSGAIVLIKHCPYDDAHDCTLAGVLDKTALHPEIVSVRGINLAATCFPSAMEAACKRIEEGLQKATLLKIDEIDYTIHMPRRANVNVEVLE